MSDLVIISKPKEAVEYLWSQRDTLDIEDHISINHPDFDITLHRIDHALFWTYTGKLAAEIGEYVKVIQTNDPA